MGSVRPWLAALALATALPAAALAQDQAPAATEAGVLPPGQFVWRPEAGRAGPLKIVVSIPLQTVYVFRNEVLIGMSSVSTGRPGHDTPLGTYTILEKQVTHHSNLYNDASMPFMQRLGWDGLALHAGHVTGAPASHGCVRLPIAFAKKLYGATQVGAVVTITDDAAPPAAAETAIEALTPSAPQVVAYSRQSAAVPPPILAAPTMVTASPDAPVDAPAALPEGSSPLPAGDQR